MPRTRQVQCRDIVEVFLSDERVVASEIESVIPKGFRQATLEEVTLRYRHDANFRDELWNKGTVWTSQKGLDSSEYHEISEDGEHSSVTRDRFYDELKPEQRSYHYNGSGRVAVGIASFGDWYKRLGIGADFGTSLIARIAYVKEDNKMTVTQNTPEKVVVSTDKFSAGKEAFRK